MIRFATAEIDRLRAILAAVDELGRGMSIGLSRATRECDALRVELAAERAQSMADCAHTDALEAAIARVRELIAEREDGICRDCGIDVIAALEGNQL